MLVDVREKRARHREQLEQGKSEEARVEGIEEQGEEEE